SIRSRATAIAARSAATISSSAPTRVNTERLWSSSLWTSSSRARAEIAAAIASTVARSRPSEKFGTASSGSIGRQPTLRLDDRPQVVVPLARLARARPVPLPRLRRGRLPARVASRPRAGNGTARLHVRPGSRRRRGRGAAAVARPRRPDAPPLARARGRRVLRDLLLRLGDALLPRPGADRPRRPDPGAARAGALRVLAGLGARAAAAAAHRHGRRARAAPAPRPYVADPVRRRALRARRRDRDPAPASVRRERLAQRASQPRAPGEGNSRRPQRARAALAVRAHEHRDAAAVVAREAVALVERLARRARDEGDDRPAGRTLEEKLEDRGADPAPLRLRHDDDIPDGGVEGSVVEQPADPDDLAVLPRHDVPRQSERRAEGRLVAVDAPPADGLAQPQVVGRGELRLRLELGHPRSCWTRPRQSKSSQTSATRPPSIREIVVCVQVNAAPLGSMPWKGAPVCVQLNVTWSATRSPSAIWRSTAHERSGKAASQTFSSACAIPSRPRFSSPQM